MNATCKTPVSVLQELCIARNITPTYIIIDDESPAHLKNFRCNVTCEKHTAEGSGRSKKKAKHAAAENMLEKMLHKPTVPSPYEGEVKADAIGPLTDFCMEYGIKCPQYTHTRAEGPSHATIFTCKCMLENFSLEAIHRVKQQSKQQVASQMLQKCRNLVRSRLKIQPPNISFTSPVEEINFKEAKSLMEDCCYNELKQYQTQDLTCCLTTDFLRFQEVFSLKPDVLIDLMNCNLNVEPKESLEILKSILKKSEINYCLIPIESEQDDMCTVILNIDVAPNLYVFEFGKNYVDACQNVALKALQYLRLLCAPMEKPKENDDIDFEELMNPKPKPL